MSGRDFSLARPPASMVALALGLVAVGILGCGAESGPSSVEGETEVEMVEAVSEDRGESGPYRLACTGIDEPTNFRQISLGRSFQGLALTAVLRTCSIGDPSRRVAPPNTLSYIYGSCDPNENLGLGEEGRCAPPLEVSVAPACLRNPGLYPGKIEVSELPRRRGVSVLSRDGGHRLELVTGSESVVIHANSPERAWAAVEELRVAPPGSSPSDLPIEAEGEGDPGRLAPPVGGVFRGRLDCSALT